MINIEKLEKWDVIGWGEDDSYGSLASEETSPKEIPTKKEETIMCSCFSEMVHLCKFSDEEEVYFTLFQHAPKETGLIERLRMAVDIFRGKRVDTFDLIFDKEQWEKLKNF